MIPRWSHIRKLTTGFSSGELVIAIDGKNRRKLLKLKEKGEFHFHNDRLRHSEIIGSHPGSSFGSGGGGGHVTIRRPSLDEYVVLMKRGPAPTYPKDIHAMAAMMDVGLGSTVLEAGAGSGGLTLHLSRTGTHMHMHTHTRLKLIKTPYYSPWLSARI